MKRILWTTVLVPALACAGGNGPEAPSPSDAVAGGAGASEPRGSEAAAVPAGYGTLRQDEVTLSLRSGALLVKVTPLDEGVIRLLAPDTYDRLSALARSRRPEAESMAGTAGVDLFLVSFFSYEPNVDFEPANLQLTHRGRILRPQAIVPITPTWGRQRLQQQETQTALYAFDPGIDLGMPLTVQYGFEQNDDWLRIVQKLEIERGKVLSRASSGG